MQPTQAQVEQHYGRGQLQQSILSALKEVGKDQGSLKPADLAPVDEFHAGGAGATSRLAARLAWSPEHRVLDVGCGLGGSARYLASEHQCRVTGIDLTPEYVDVANTLTELVGLKDLVDIHQGNALELPFERDSFDVVWTEHGQMNIADKRGFYSELARVLKPQGRLIFHDIFLGGAGSPHYPVPWAEDDSISSLATPDEVRQILDELDFAIQEWEDESQAELQLIETMMEQAEQAEPSPLGLHLLMGENIGEKVVNLLNNLREDRIAVYQAVAQKR